MLRLHKRLIPSLLLSLVLLMASSASASSPARWAPPRPDSLLIPVAPSELKLHSSFLAPAPTSPLTPRNVSPPVQSLSRLPASLAAPMPSLARTPFGQIRPGPGNFGRYFKGQSPQTRAPQPDPRLHGKPGGPAEIEAIRERLAASRMAAGGAGTRSATTGGAGTRSATTGGAGAAAVRPAQAEPVTLTVTPQVIPPEEPTLVVVRAVQAGAPVAGVTVFAGWEDQTGHVTDGNGEAVFTVELPYVMAAPVYSKQADTVDTHLFALLPEFAGVEVSGLDAAGLPFANYWATVDTLWQDYPWSWSDWSDEPGPIGLVAPAGEATVELVAEGSPYYLLSQSVTLAPYQVTTLTLNAAAAAPITLKAALDETPLAGGNVLLRSTGKVGPGWLSGAYLDANGEAPAYLTPGAYTARLLQTGGERPLLAVLDGLAVGSGTLDLTVKSGDLGTLDLGVTAGGAPAPFWLTLVNQDFWSTVPYQRPLAVTGGAYEVSWLGVRLAQPSGGEWEYTLDPYGAALFVAAGSTVVQRWPADVAAAYLWLWPSEYEPDSPLCYQPSLWTQDGWELRWVFDTSTDKEVALSAITITDSSGAVVHAATTGWGGGCWDVPADPSPSYQVNLVRTMGALGSHTASAVATRYWPLVLELSREILPVGATTGVRVTATRGGVPVRNAWVAVMGETVREGRTNTRGQVTFQLKPTRTGTWMVAAEDGVTFAYALEPGYGLLDVAATDRTGAPLPCYLFTAGGTLESAASEESEAWHCAGWNEKLILPVGEHVLAVRGGNWTENYYLTVQGSVLAQKAQVVTADGAATVALSGEVEGTAYAQPPYLFLRSTRVDYFDLWGVPHPLTAEANTYVTPGEYDVLRYLPGNWHAWVMPAEHLSLTADTTLPLNVADANSTLKLEGRTADGQKANLALAVLQKGRFVVPFEDWGVTTPTVRVVPGAYQTLGGLTLFFSPTSMWLYEFAGTGTIEARAGETTPVILGGPLKAQVRPDQAAYRPGDRVTMTGAGYTENGLYLAGGLGVDAQGWFWLSPNFVFIYNDTFESFAWYWGESTTWESVRTPGTYNLFFIQPGMGYGQMPTAEGSLQLLKPVRP